MITSLKKEIAETKLTYWARELKKENRRLMKLNHDLKKQIKEKENELDGYSTGQYYNEQRSTNQTF